MNKTNMINQTYRFKDNPKATVEVKKIEDGQVYCLSTAGVMAGNLCVYGEYFFNLMFEAI